MVRRKFIFMLLILSTMPLLSPAQRYGDTPEDSIECVKQVSLYREYYKSWQRKNYESDAVVDAIKHWRYVFMYCPMATKNTYINGAKMIDYFIENAESDAIREKYIDTLVMVYEQRIKYFGEKGEVLGRKAVDLYKLRPNAIEDIYTTFKESVDLEGNKTSYVVLIYYFRSAIKYVLEGFASKSLIVETYALVSDIIDYNLKNTPKKQKLFESARDDVDKNFDPFATCEGLIEIYSEDIEQYPDDVDVLTTITTMLDRYECNESDLFFTATEKLHALKPTGESAYLMGVMNFKKENYVPAAEYLKESLELIADQKKQADIFLILTEIYKRQKQYSTARNYAYKVLELRPKEGNAYILIGDMYAESAPNCYDDASKKELQAKAPYWAAVDKYYNAKQIDPSVSELADKRIATYSRYFPDEKTLFFYTLEKGDSYTVGCWINETTKVR